MTNDEFKVLYGKWRSSHIEGKSSGHCSCPRGIFYVDCLTLFVLDILDDTEHRVQRESYSVARSLWATGLCDLLKLSYPSPDASGLDWLFKEGTKALEAIRRDERRKVAVRLRHVAESYREGGHTHRARAFGAIADELG